MDIYTGRGEEISNFHITNETDEARPAKKFSNSIAGEGPRGGGLHCTPIFIIFFFRSTLSNTVTLGS